MPIKVQKMAVKEIKKFNKSPSRILCDLFWNSINYKDLELQLNSKINFFNDENDHSHSSFHPRPGN